MRKVLIFIFYFLTLSLINVSYSASASITFKNPFETGIPAMITSSDSVLENMKLLKRHTNETYPYQWDKYLKNGLLKHNGIIRSKKSKENHKSLNFFVFDYTFDVSKVKDLKAISKMSFMSGPSNPLYVIGKNETTGAQNIFKINSMILSNGKLVANVFCAARFSETNPSLVKVSSQSEKSLKELNLKVNKKRLGTRNQNFRYTRLLNEGCFFSVKDKNKVSFDWIDSKDVPLTIRKLLAEPQYSK